MIGSWCLGVVANLGIGRLLTCLALRGNFLWCEVRLCYSCITKWAMEAVKHDMARWLDFMSAHDITHSRRWAEKKLLWQIHCYSPVSIVGIRKGFLDEQMKWAHVYPGREMFAREQSARDSKLFISSQLRPLAKTQDIGRKTFSPGLQCVPWLCTLFWNILETAKADGKEDWLACPPCGKEMGGTASVPLFLRQIQTCAPSATGGHRTN